MHRPSWPSRQLRPVSFFLLPCSCVILNAFLPSSSTDCTCSAAFITAAQSCIASCSSEDQQTALGMFQQACRLPDLSPTLIFDIRLLGDGATSASGPSTVISSTSASATANDSPSSSSDSSSDSSPGNSPDDSAAIAPTNAAATSTVLPTSTLTRLSSLSTTLIRNGTATGVATSTASTAAALTNFAAQSIWVLVAGVLGIAVL